MTFAKMFIIPTIRGASSLRMAVYQIKCVFIASVDLQVSNTPSIGKNTTHTLYQYGVILLIFNIYLCERHRFLHGFSSEPGR